MLSVELLSFLLFDSKQFVISFGIHFYLFIRNIKLIVLYFPFSVFFIKQDAEAYSHYTIGEAA